MRQVTLYTRAGCHLCEDALDVLRSVRADEPFDLGVVDVDGDPALVQAFGNEVPVVLVDGRKAFKYRLTADALRARLGRGV